ncbi:MAG: ribonuclease H [Planctomycetota bacterium]
MNRYALFSDVSLNPGLKLGFGAYLLIPSSVLEISPEGMAQPEFARQIKLRRFDATSSTKLEVQTLLWALEDFQKEALGSRFGTLDVYSDSQCVTGLLRRRGSLEIHGFCSGRTERPLKNACLYRKFYELYDALGFEVIKVAGHSRSSAHDSIHRIFSFVDKEAGRALRLFMKECLLY